MALQPIDELVARLLKNSAPAHEFYEIGQKKSLFMINPESKQIFYVDKLHRPLLPNDVKALTDSLPAGYSFTDISRLESTNSHNFGFHSSQPTFPEDDNERWLAYAKQKIEGYSKVAAADVKEPVIEKTQTVPQPMGFFTKSPLSAPDIKTPDVISTPANTKRGSIS